MRIKAVFAAALSAVILTGCAAVFDELTDGTYEEGTFTDETTSAVTDEKSSLSYGTGLEEITITAQEDPDPDRQIQRRRTPVRQIRGVDINGNTLSDDFYFYRSLLSGTYKQAYDQIYSALYNGSQTISMSVLVYSSDIVNIVYSVYYDHPELFWLDSNGYDDIDYDNYDDWEDYYFGDIIDDDYYYDDYYHNYYDYDEYCR